MSAILSESVTLPCGLVFPNRLCKGAMAEGLAPETHVPDGKFETVYGEWGDGGWGMLLTGNVMVSETFWGSPGDVVCHQHATKPATTSEQEAWKSWADTCQRSGTPTIVQLCHPGRQSPAGTGNRGFFTKAVAPSAVKLDFGPRLIEKVAVTIAFGTPRALTVEEISGPEGIIDQFVGSAKRAFEAGFKGVQFHAAHGYLLAQFLSSKSNIRTDEFGGTPAKRAEVLLRCIRAVRAATSPGFCIGIKMNSVDASESLADTIEQMKLIVETGIDFIEVSGGTYENPRMMVQAPSDALPVSKRTAARESFFLEFAETARKTFPDVVFMVTGGFRTRSGMENAVKTGACDLVGIGRPAAVVPKLPKEIILNKDVPDEKAQVYLTPVPMPYFQPIKQIGSGKVTVWYQNQIQRIAKGLKPDEGLRVKIDG